MFELLDSLPRRQVDRKEVQWVERGHKEAELQGVLWFRFRLEQLVDSERKEAVEWDLEELGMFQQSVLN